MEIRVKSSAELIEAVKNANESSEKTTIILEKGDYEIAQTLNLNGNIEIIGEDEVSLYGTKRVSIEKAEVNNGIYKINLSDFGITDNGRFGLGPYRDFWLVDIPKPHMEDNGPSLELYFGERKMNISRYPREGFMRIKKALGETEFFFREEHNGTKEGIFIPSDTEFFKNEDIENMLLIGYWKHDWATQRHLIDSYDKETGVIKIKEPYHNFGYRDGTCYTGEIGGRFYAINVLGGVKEPGDWYIDRIANEIYFIPFEGQGYIDIALCENMFEAENASEITIKNVTVSRCRKSAFKFTNCENVHIENCTMYYLGAWGAILDWCNNSNVSHCKVYNTGGGGIACSGGDRATLKSSGNIVNNNEIHDIAYWHKTYLAAIEMNGVNVIASENKIYDVPHFGIVYQGNEHIIEKNYFRNTCYESNDAGAIYAGKDYACRGIKIRYNHFQDILGFEGKGCIAIYFDDGVCTAEVYGNTLTNVPYVGIQIGGGRDYDIHDNMFFNCKMVLSLDNRLDRWKSGNTRLVQYLDNVPYRSEIWKNAYPKLYDILDDEPTLPKYNKFYNNIIVGGDGATFTNEEVAGYLEHYGNTFIPRSDNGPHNPNQATWYFLTDEL